MEDMADMVDLHASIAPACPCESNLIFARIHCDNEIKRILRDSD